MKTTNDKIWDEAYEKFRAYVTDTAVEYEPYDFKEWLKLNYIIRDKMNYTFTLSDDDLRD